MKKVNTESFPYDKYRSGKQVRFVMEDSFSSQPSTQSLTQQSPSGDQSAKQIPNKSGKPSKQPPVNNSNKAPPQNAVPGHSFLKKAEILFNASQKNNENNQLDASQASGFSTSFALSQSGANGARLTDLCPEDRARIGELMKKLAAEKEEKEQLRKALEEKDAHYSNTLEHLEKEKEEVVKESKDLQSQFKYSLNLLKSFQEINKNNNNNNAASKSTLSNYSFNESLLKADQREKLAHHISDKENISYENLPDREMSREEERVDKSLNLRHLAEFENPLRGPLNNIQRQEKNGNEIAKLKDDIEELAHNLRNVSFSPNKSFLTNSMLHENDQFLRSKAPVPEDRPSPIKLVESFNPQKKYPQQQEEPVSQKKPKAKPPKAKQDSSINRFLKVPASLEAGSSSEDDDELAIAQKWLNLRKQKINEINNQIDEENYVKEQQNQSYQEEKPQQQIQKTASQTTMMRQLEERYSPIKYETPTHHAFPTHPKVNAFQTSPGFPEPVATKSPNKLPPKANYNSAGKMGNLSPQRPETNKISSNSANKSKSEITFDLNAMTPNEMFELKKILDERLEIAQLRERANELTSSTELKMKRIEQILQSPENQKFSAKRESRANSRSPDYRFLDEAGGTARSGNPLLLNATKPFEPLDTLVRTIDTKKDSKATFVDSSIMKDFESISEYSTPQALKLQSQALMKDKLEEITTRRPNQHEDQSEYEALYEEKLKEFLRIRDRMLQSKGLKSARDLNVEAILQSTLKAEAYKYQMEDTARHSDTSKMTSPPFRSIEKSADAPTLSERDLLYSDQSRVRQGTPSMGLNTRLMTQESKFMTQESRENTKRSPILKHSPNTVTTRKSPMIQQRHITFDTEQPVKTERKIVTEVDAESDENIMALNDDFYDDGLFDLVEGLENDSPSNFNSGPVQQKRANVAPSLANAQAKKEVAEEKTKSSIDDEFKSLFTSVKTMIHTKEKENDKVSKKLIHKFEKTDMHLTTVSSEDEQNSSSQQSIDISEPKSSYRKSSQMDFPKDFFKRRDSGANGSSFTGNVSSFIETDTSVLVINKKVNEMKKAQQKAKASQRHQFTFRK